jgi:inner membrane protein
MLGSVLPDIDVEDSIVTGIIPKLPFKHRTITHSFFALVVVTIVAAIFSRYFALGMFFGYLSHLLLDSLNPIGVPFFYPFNKIKYNFARIRAGGWIDNLIFFVFMFIDIFVILEKINLIIRS